MRKFLIALFIITFTLSGVIVSAQSAPVQSETSVQENSEGQPRVLPVPQRRRRRVRADRRRSRRGIGAAYSRAGRSAGRGGAGFGRNIARGRPIRAGRELGRGMGGFGRTPASARRASDGASGAPRGASFVDANCLLRRLM